MQLGKNLKKIRKYWDLEQEDIAEILNVNRTVISNYELNKSNPKLDTLLRIEEITSIPIYKLCKTSIDSNILPAKPYLDKNIPNKVDDNEGDYLNIELNDLRKKCIALLEENIEQRKLIKELEKQNKS